ncbi:MAG: hypothetical protein ACRC14_10545 [Paracoccaceae bacterium]
MTDLQTGPDTMANLLDQAHLALRQADYAKLGGLTVAIEVELARLETVQDLAGLARVQQRATRNAACLLSAQRGLRAARRRVEEIKRARSGLVTYGPSGSRAEPHRHGLLIKRF